LNRKYLANWINFTAILTQASPSITVLHNLTKILNILNERQYSLNFDPKGQTFHAVSQVVQKNLSFFIRHEQDSAHIPLSANTGNASTFHTGKIKKKREREKRR
jgi:hypothetical protein